MADTGPRFRFGVATPDDDDAIRSVLRRTPTRGDVSLNLCREPSVKHAAAIEGPVHDYVVARDAHNQEIVAIATRSERDVWLNGERRPIGYLSQLRVLPEYQHRFGLLPRGFATIRELHQRGRVPFYVSTVFSDNASARAIVERPSRVLPTYAPHATLVTLTLPIWRRCREARVSGCAFRQATTSDWPEIADCLQRNLRRYQFAPYWSADDLADPERTRDLDAESFYVATRGGSVIGCLAVWDQQAFKQTVVDAYAGHLARLRWLTNLAAPWVGWPRLPAPGGRLSHAFLSMVAIDDDASEVFAALCQRAFNAVRGRDYAFLTTTLAERHPLLPTLRRAFRHIDYPSILYRVFWEDGEDAAMGVDGRCAHLEGAVL